MVRRFSQKHYIEIAKLLKSLNGKAQGCKIALCDVDEAFINLFSEDSNKFNKAKFLKALGYNRSDIEQAEESDGQPTEQKEFEDLEGIEQEIYQEPEE